MGYAYTYGNQNLNDGINFFILEKPYDFPTYVQSLFKIARLEGMKKTAETVNQRTIGVKVKIISDSRADLEAQIESLYQSLALRQQQLVLNTDTRYFIADCTDVKVTLSAGLPISAVADITFVCLQPYAYAASPSTYTSGSMSQAPSSGVCTYPVQTVTGGGSIYSRPTIVIKQTTTATSWTALTIAQQTDLQSITITSGLPTAKGDTVTIYCDPSIGPNGFTAQLNTNGTPLPFTGQFPVQDAGATAWQVSLSASATTAISFTLNWTPRLLG